MCGIAGICRSGGVGFDLEGPLRAMGEGLRHRGPDDCGLFISPDRVAGLAHTRLSILDPSPAGHQPMSTADGRLTIVLNGEIYNFWELRRKLEEEGESFLSQSDTEVVLRLYERLGPDCVERLQGMFAFAIWDDRTGSCFLARDPLGIKPLYLARTASGLLFASELRALLRSGRVARELDAARVRGYFETGSVPEPGTLVRDVEVLSAGSWLLWSGGGERSKRWWEVRFPWRSDVGDDPGVSVRTALLDSVRRHFVSDVPVGAFLSGGIDSTAIVALSHMIGRQDLRTFSIRFEDPRYDEGEVARRTAEHFATRHAERVLDASTGKPLFEQFLSRLDQPSIDGFNTFIVAQFAHSEGMKVVLSGLGGDELFGGYPSFRELPRLLRWSRMLDALPGFRPLASRILSKSRRPQMRRLSGFLSSSPAVGSAYRAFRGVFSVAEASALASQFAHVPVDEIEAPWPAETWQPTLADSISAMELELYMRNQLLRDSDVMSMAWGLELRVPFVDSELIQKVAEIPSSLRLRKGKKMLLEAVPEIPAWVVNQPKRGFQFPFDQWLSGDWKDLFEVRARYRRVCAQTWYQKWSLFVFERWCIDNDVIAG